MSTIGNGSSDMTYMMMLSMSNERPLTKIKVLTLAQNLRLVAVVYRPAGNGVLALPVMVYWPCQ